MGSNLHDVYYCQMNRTQQLSDRMYNRNIPSHQIGQSYFARPVDTYATKFPILDCHNPSTVSKAIFPPYSQRQVFNPGQAAPYEGFSKNVDIESSLHNSFHPTQKCVQGKYIPGSRSDMYNANYLIPASKPVIKSSAPFRKFLCCKDTVDDIPKSLKKDVFAVPCFEIFNSPFAPNANRLFGVK